MLMVTTKIVMTVTRPKMLMVTTKIVMIVSKQKMLTVITNKVVAVQTDVNREQGTVFAGLHASHQRVQARIKNQIR